MLLQTCAQATSAVLTELLTTRGVLHQGHIVTVVCDTHAVSPGYVSNVAVLHLTYSPDARGARPARLFLKMSRPDLHPETRALCRQEIVFYQAMTARGATFALPHCYDAAADPQTGQTHLILEDLSLTHFQQPLPVPPAYRHCELLVEGLARVHATWWNDPQLGVAVGERLTPPQALATRRRLEATMPAFLDYLGDALVTVQRRAYEQILAASFWARHVDRLCALQQVTLIHGDAHTGNVLLPRNPAQDPVILIDWQRWAINTAPMDLAFLMALHWPPALRAVREAALLRHYHAHLQMAGVAHYSWEDLWRDYREAVIITTLIPVGQFRRQMPAGVIWFGLQDSLAAFHDLHCAELL